MTEDASENRFLDTVREARRVWLEENDPRDGTDCVTPFDKFLYGLPVPRAKEVSRQSPEVVTPL